MSKKIFTIIGLICGVIGLFLVVWHLTNYLKVITLVNQLVAMFSGEEIDMTGIQLEIIGGLIALIIGIIFLALSPYTEAREKNEDIEEKKIEIEE